MTARCPPHPPPSGLQDFLRRSPALDSDGDLWRMHHACQGPTASAAGEATSVWERELPLKMDGLALLTALQLWEIGGPAVGEKGQCVLSGHWAQWGRTRGTWTLSSLCFSHPQPCRRTCHLSLERQTSAAQASLCVLGRLQAYRHAFWVCCFQKECPLCPYPGH